MNRRTALLWLTTASLTACAPTPAAPSTDPPVPKTVLLQIIEAEDTRTWNSGMVNLLSDSNPNVRLRAALAAGRIGDVSATPLLIGLLKEKDSKEVAAMAAFALGEIESPTAVPELIESLKYSPLMETLKLSDEKSIRAAAVEALGKISETLPETDALRKRIGEAILGVLKEQQTAKHVHHDIIRKALTAAARARPGGAPPVIAMYLDWPETDEALDGLASLKDKGSLNRIQDVLATGGGPDTRAKAALVLRIAGDASAVGILEKTMATDVDIRPRVESIRALAAIAQKRSAAPLLKHADELLSSKSLPADELLEIADALKRISPGSSDEKAVLDRLREAGIKNPAPASVTPTAGKSAGKSRHTKADYERAVARIGTTQGALFKTDKGDITIEFLPEIAPLTVDNFIKLVQTHYFDGLSFSRSASDLIIQSSKGGRADSIRCEINPVDFSEHIVGMVNSGKDTGSSQFFITQARQSMRDGKNTVFARVFDGWKVVRSLHRDARILSAMIVEDVYAKYRGMPRL